MGGLSYGQITTSIYLKVSVSDFLTLFSARTGDDWFWATTPAPILIAAACVALTASTILAITWPASYPDGIYAIGLGYEQPYLLPVYIWIYCIIWWLIQDAVKVACFYWLKSNNIFGVNESGVVVLPDSTIEFMRAQERAATEKTKLLDDQDKRGGSSH